MAQYPCLAGAFSGKVSNLAETLNQEGTRAAAADFLCGLIGQVKLRPDRDARHGCRIAVFGGLDAIVSLCPGNLAANAKARRAAAGFRQFKVVAGTGFEPVTFRL